MELSEQDLTALADLGVSEEKLEALRNQMMQAEAMRFQAGPSMRGAGKVVVAANPLEHLATAIQQYRGGRRMQDLRQQQEQAANTAAATRASIMSRLLGGQQAPSAPAASAAPQRISPYENALRNPTGVYSG